MKNAASWCLNAVALLGFLMGCFGTADAASLILESQRSMFLSSVSRYVPGTPLQNTDTPILITACDLEYSKPLGAADQTVTYRYTLYNQTAQNLHLVALTDAFDFSSFQEAFVYDMRPKEYRVVEMPRDASPQQATGILLGKHRPTFFLCGSGPEQTSDGLILPYSSLAMRSLKLTRLLVPTVDGRFVSPFKTTKSVILDKNSTFIPGAPIQPIAASQQPSFTASTPPRNSVPYIVQSCSLAVPTLQSRDREIRIETSVYNQMRETLGSVRVTVQTSDKAVSVQGLVKDLKVRESRVTTWTVARDSKEYRDLLTHRPDKIFCGVGPGMTAGGAVVKYDSLTERPSSGF